MKQKRMFKTNEYVSIDYETLGDFKKSLDEWIKKHGPDARFEYYEEYGDRYLAIMAEREETDREYNKRLEEEAHWKAIAEERDRKEFERLKAKYEDPNEWDKILERPKVND